MICGLSNDTNINDLEWLRVIRLLQAFSSGIMSTVMQHDKISTETAHHVVSWFKLNWTELSKVLRPTCTKQVISETFFPAISWLATETQMSPRVVAYKI